MGLFIWVAYGTSLGVALIFFLHHQRILTARKKMAGMLLVKWSSLFNLSFPMSWVRWAAVFLYLGWCVYQISVSPGSNSGHMSLMLLVLLFSFSPRGNIYVGSEGIVFRMKFIPWTAVRERKMVMRGRRNYLESHLWRIPLPGNAPDLTHQT